MRSSDEILQEATELLTLGYFSKETLVEYVCGIIRSTDIFEDVVSSMGPRAYIVMRVNDEGETYVDNAYLDEQSALHRIGSILLNWAQNEYVDDELTEDLVALYLQRDYREMMRQCRGELGFPTVWMTTSNLRG